MIKGLLLVLALAVVGGRVGLAIGNWAAHSNPGGEIESAIPPFVGTVLGAAAGIAIGLGIAYVLGRVEERKQREES